MPKYCSLNGGVFINNIGAAFIQSLPAVFNQDQEASKLQSVLEVVDNEREELLISVNAYQGAMKKTISLLETFDAEFQTMYDHNPIHHLESRIKSADSIIGKIERKGLELSLETILEQITDVVGIRIVCPYSEDIYYLTDLICRQEELEVIRKSDYIACPKKNGYRSMHLVIKVPVTLSQCTRRVPVEIQLRTIAMDMWASLEHELHYKSQREPAEHLVDRLKYCADVLAELDGEMGSIYKQINN